MLRPSLRLFSTVAPMNFFGHLKMGPPDPIFGIVDMFQKDKAPNKVNLSIGVYRNADGTPHVFRAVRKAEEDLARFDSDKEYVPGVGEDVYVEYSKQLIFGNNKAITDRIASVHSVSGCGSLSLMCQYLAHYDPRPALALFIPTWDNHYPIFHYVKNIMNINMYDQKSNGFLFDHVMDQLKNKVPERSVVLMQACANNPTGIDPTEDQWVALSRVCKDRKLMPLIDSAYLGFVTGNIDKDSFAIKLLVEDGHTFAYAQSYSKNMAMYGERVGVLNFVCPDKEKAKSLRGLFGTVNNEICGSPVTYPARVVTKVLASNEYRQDWLAELKEVTGRILSMRNLLYQKLKELKTPGSWEFILKQRGLFTYLGLKPEQCDELIKRHVYVLRSGRMCVAGLNPQNVGVVAKTLHEVITQ